MKKKYQIKMWSNWLEELWDAGENFYRSFKSTPNTLRGSLHTLSQFEFMADVSPIGKEIKNIVSDKNGNETQNPKISELELKDFTVLQFVRDSSVIDKSFYLEVRPKVKAN